MRRTLSTLLLLMVTLPAFASAQMTGVTIKTIDETTATLGLNDWRDFHFEVFNTSGEDIQFYVERTEQNIPSDDWFSTICMEDFCYRADQSKTELSTIPSGGVYKVKFTVYTGPDVADGTFQLKFMHANGFSTLETVDFAVAAGGSSVIDAETLGLLPYPMPATSAVTIPGTTIDAADIQIVAADGRTIDGTSTTRVSGGVRIDTESLAPGVYFCLVRDGEAVVRHRFVVAR